MPPIFCVLPGWIGQAGSQLHPDATFHYGICLTLQFVDGFGTLFRVQGTLGNGMLVMIGFACPDKQQMIMAADGSRL